jgi:hypothetical protein
MKIQPKPFPMVPIRFRSARCPGFSPSWFASAGRCWLSLALCALVSAASLRAQTPDAPAGGKKAEAEESDDTANMTAMMIPGQDVKGMRYAHRNENDEVVMEFESEVARKLDDENIEMENLKIVAFDEEGKRADILLPRSVFNVTTRILTGKDQVVIKRDDVEIIGETGEFNTKTRFAKLLGNVKMIILNTENLDKKNTEKTDQ